MERKIDNWLISLHLKQIKKLYCHGNLKHSTSNCFIKLYCRANLKHSTSNCFILRKILKCINGIFQLVLFSCTFSIYFIFIHENHRFEKYK